MEQITIIGLIKAIPAVVSAFMSLWQLIASWKAAHPNHPNSGAAFVHEQMINAILPGLPKTTAKVNILNPIVNGTAATPYTPAPDFEHQSLTPGYTEAQKQQDLSDLDKLAQTGDTNVSPTH
jgi:hypothetical protein